jgi:hypothetical protein
MKKLEWVRWSTPKEIESLNNYFKTKQKSNGLEWLSQNSKDVIHQYYLWIDNYKDKKIREKEDKYNDYLHSISEKNKEYEYIYSKLKRGGSIQCKCRGNLRIVNYYGGDFIGCDNYKENVEHSKITRVNQGYYFNYSDELANFEYPKQYLSFFLKDVYPSKGIKASNLYEFLKINNIPLLVDINDDFFYSISKITKNSRDRETLVKGVLEAKFNKVKHQAHITCKYEGERQRIKKPDFICLNGNDVIIFEQKKTIDNCNEDQLNEYILLVQGIFPDKKVDGFFIIELANQNDLPFNCFTLKTLTDEFSK